MLPKQRLYDLLNFHHDQGFSKTFHPKTRERYDVLTLLLECDFQGVKESHHRCHLPGRGWHIRLREELEHV